MASKSIAVPASESDWRARDDHSTLMRACEVMADKIRMKGVLAEHARQNRAERKLETLLSRHRAGKLKHY